MVGTWTAFASLDLNRPLASSPLIIIDQEERYMKPLLEFYWSGRVFQTDGSDGWREALFLLEIISAIYFQGLSKSLVLEDDWNCLIVILL